MHLRAAFWDPILHIFSRLSIQTHLKRFYERYLFERGTMSNEITNDTPNANKTVLGTNLFICIGALAVGSSPIGARFGIPKGWRQDLRGCGEATPQSGPRDCSTLFMKRVHQADSLAVSERQ